MSVWKKDSCCSCGDDELLVTVYSSHTGKEHSHCYLCYSSKAGSACEYPRNYDDGIGQTLMGVVQIIHAAFPDTKKLKDKA